jgi:hypothetical protein
MARATAEVTLQLSNGGGHSGGTGRDISPTTTVLDLEKKTVQEAFITKELSNRKQVIIGIEAAPGSLLKVGAMQGGPHRDRIIPTRADKGLLVELKHERDPTSGLIALHVPLILRLAISLGALKCRALAGAVDKAPERLGLEPSLHIPSPGRIVRPIELRE